MNGSFCPTLTGTLTDTELLATVGITDYAQTALGDVVYVELPIEGDGVEAGDTIGAIESVKSASDIFSPVSGTIVEANAELVRNPGLINGGAEDDRWICKIEVKDSKEIGALMDKAGYDAYVKGLEH
ncbi:glycine cleavage system H-protein [Tuber indicum]|nr:glycine cleavage system H-protein [Tuber indicum]